KAIKESRAEVEKCAWTVEYFADHGKIFATDEVVNTDARKSIITFEPLGVIGSIMPWNFPYWQGLRFTAPSLMVGNTIILKPASATMQCGIEIENPFIVCEDADIEKASTGAVKGRFINCGQSCIASKRFIVTNQVANEFTEKFVQKTERLKVGDPLSDDTDIGPVVNAKSLENMEGIVNRTMKEG